MAAKKLPPLPELMEFCQLVNDLDSKPDTDLVVLSMAYLDTVLEKAIISGLINTSGSVIYSLFGHRGSALSSLASKIDVAAALGVLSDSAREDLHALREIRNLYAHAFSTPSWDSPDVKKFIDKLKTTTADISQGPFKGADFSVYENIQETQLDDGFGGIIDTSIHDLLLDRDNQVGFYCKSVAGPEIKSPEKRRYLECYWTCILRLMNQVVNHWPSSVDFAATQQAPQLE